MFWLKKFAKEAWKTTFITEIPLQATIEYTSFSGYPLREHEIPRGTLGANIRYLIVRHCWRLNYCREGVSFRCVRRSARVWPAGQKGREHDRIFARGEMLAGCTRIYTRLFPGVTSQSIRTVCKPSIFHSLRILSTNCTLVQLFTNRDVPISCYLQKFALTSKSA